MTTRQMMMMMMRMIRVLRHHRQDHSRPDGKYSERVQIPAKALLSPTLGNTCHTYYFAAR